MSPDISFAVATGCGVGAFALAAATLFIPTRQITSEPAAPEPSPAWLVCDDLRCAHTTTPHRPTPVGGLACDYCGTVRTEAS